MTSTSPNLEDPRRAPHEETNGRRYALQFGGALLLYGVLLTFAVVVVPDDSPTAAQRLLAALPAIGAAVAIAAYVNFFRNLDEFQQSIQLKGMSLGFGVAMLSAIALGCAGLPGDPSPLSQAAPWIIFVSAMATWVIAVGVLSHRSDSWS